MKCCEPDDPASVAPPSPNMPVLGGLRCAGSILLFAFLAVPPVILIAGCFSYVWMNSPAPFFWMLVAGAGALAAALLVRARRATPSSESTELPSPRHRGINMSAIPLAGIPGLVFALGFVFMFWFGAPSYRPFVVVIAVLGTLSGVGLILVRRRSRSSSRTGSILWRR